MFTCLLFYLKHIGILETRGHKMVCHMDNVVFPFVHSLSYTFDYSDAYMCGQNESTNERSESGHQSSIPGYLARRRHCGVSCLLGPDGHADAIAWSNFWQTIYGQNFCRHAVDCDRDQLLQQSHAES